MTRKSKRAQERQQQQQQRRKHTECTHFFLLNLVKITGGRDGGGEVGRNDNNGEAVGSRSLVSLDYLFDVVFLYTSFVLNYNRIVSQVQKQSKSKSGSIKLNKKKEANDIATAATSITTKYKETTRLVNLLCCL